MPNRKDQMEDPLALFKSVQLDTQDKIHVAIPANIVSYDPKYNTCSVQPNFFTTYSDEENNVIEENMPILEDIPVLLPHTKDFLISLPIQKDDECLLIIADQCIDAIIQSGGIQKEVEFRRHDYSDAFVLMGYYNYQKVPPSINTSNIQVRTTDGANYIEMEPSGKINIKSTVEIHLEAPSITSKGNWSHS